MGTRGLVGFRYKNRYYLMYCHYDCYLSGVGVALLREIKTAMLNGTFETWIEQFKTVTIVDVSNSGGRNYLDTNEDMIYSEEEYDERDTEFFDINDMRIIRRSPRVSEMDKLREYCNTSVGEQHEGDWYCLLREVQGSFVRILTSQHLLLHAKYKEMTGDVFIEYSYVLDFDSDNFHVYTSKGFYKTVNLLDEKQIDNAILDFEEY